MKGQRIMKHTSRLIGCPVQVTAMEWHRPDIPRAGVITGFGGSGGLFNVTVFSDCALDIRRGKMPTLHLTNVLLIDDADDRPIGVHMYARVYQQPLSSQAVDQVDGMYTQAGQAAAPDEDVKVDPDALIDDETVEEEGSSDESPDVKTEEKPKGDKGPLPAGAPIDLLMKNDVYAPIEGIEGTFSTKTGENELAITIDHDEKPIARITWRNPEEEPGQIIRSPFGFSIKVRDSGGRCSRIMCANVPNPSKELLECVAGAISAAKGADLGDYGSSAANMTEWINKAAALS